MKKKYLLIGLALLVLIAPVFAAGRVETQPTSSLKEIAEVEQMSALNSNPLSDVRVRQAIAYAIDMDTIAETFFDGMVTPADSLTPDNGLGLNDYAYDPEKAKELLKEAGWDKSHVLNVVYTYTDQQTVDFMAIIQQYLAAVGIQMKASLLEGNTSAMLWTKPSDGVNGPSAVEWDMYYGAIGASSQYAFYGRFQTGGSNNSHTPGNTELDDLISRVYATAEASKQKELFDEIQIFMNKQLPVLPLYHMDVYSIESDKVIRNNAPYGNEQYSYDWKIETWDIAADKNGKKVLHTNNAPAEYFWEPFANANGNVPNKLLYDHLVVANSDCDEFAPQQCENYYIDDNGLKITFVLKDGLKWHDGSDITG
ncbi:MAG: ABC transporter substrate-binding protein, partial [Sphaerochaetaceae bacterium]|nr:ABC transporter substrate-binding protein [Sphaerochaetaceae bacterium]